MWCIKKANFYPIMFSMFFIATLDSWLALFGCGYLAGTIIYILIQFDTKYKRRNQLDCHYANMLIALPGFTGINQRFHPHHTMLRLIFIYISMLFVLVWPALMLDIVQFLKVPVQWPQVSTVTGCVNKAFQLSGSIEVHSLIAFDKRVIAFH